MLFHSIDFAIFLPLVFILYWFVAHRNLKIQNLLIVISSYVFYGWWDWRFLSLILFSTIVDFFLGLVLEKENNQAKRKFLLWTSISVNLGLLGFFKYYNFFIENFVAAFSLFGTPIEPNTLNIILPVGISFYTFQTLGYTIDIYKRRLSPTISFINFACFVAFFPQLVAGPIERAKDLLPQFHKERSFVYEKAVDGMRQILWGLFKKVAIADNCAVFANQIFNNSDDYTGITLIIGALFFAFQIYADFSGYSDIAIGTARLFGFDLKQNFAVPFFSRDFKEFWKRWHISLTTWFRDYVFIPLVKSYPINIYTKICNIFVLFFVIGVWHGSNWTFFLWGLLHGIYFLPTLFYKNKIINLGIIAKGKFFPRFDEFVSMVVTFGLTVFSMIIFRAKDLSHAFQFISSIFRNPSLFFVSNYLSYIYVICLLIVFNIVEWIGREKQYSFAIITWVNHSVLRLVIYLLIFFIILYYFTTSIPQEFIYFDF